MSLYDDVEDGVDINKEKTNDIGNYYYIKIH